jgi:hypothetical protein
MTEVSDAVDKTKDLNLITLISDGKNPRGIPAAKFIVRM